MLSKSPRIGGMTLHVGRFEYHVLCRMLLFNNKCLFRNDFTKRSTHNLKKHDSYQFLVGWFPVTLRFIGTYVSKYQWDFLNYGAYRCDDLRFPRKAYEYRFQCKRPIVGQYVTLRNWDHTDPDENEGRYYVMTLQEVQVFGKGTFK